MIPRFLTNALIQNVRTTVRMEIFGDPDQNLTYLPKLEEVLCDAGHDFEISTKTSDQVKKRLLEVILIIINFEQHKLLIYIFMDNTN